MGKVDPIEEILEMKGDIGDIKESVGTFIGKVDQYIESQNVISAIQQTEISNLRVKQEISDKEISDLKLSSAQNKTEVMDFIDDSCEEFKEEILEHSSNENIHYKDPEKEGIQGYAARRWYVVLPAILGGIGAIITGLVALISKIMEVTG